MDQKKPKSNVAGEVLERLRHIDRAMESYRQRTSKLMTLVIVMAALQILALAGVTAAGYVYVTGVDARRQSDDARMLDDIGKLSGKLDEKSAGVDLQALVKDVDINQLMNLMGQYGGAINEQLDLLEGRPQQPRRRKPDTQGR